MINTDHNMSKRDAKELRGIPLLPREIRIQFLHKFYGRKTKSELIELLADFVGIANQITKSSEEVIAALLKPEDAARLNMPTLDGALAGVQLAVDPVPGMCHGCAFRQGSAGNASPVTTWDAEDILKNGGKFMCHAKFDKRGKNSKLCAGFKAARAELFRQSR